MPFSDIQSIAVIFAALALGGMLKGATGAGAPLAAVPVIAAVFDVRLAVAIMVLPSLLLNIWQARAFRSHVTDPNFAFRFALGGAVGAVAGTWLLATMPEDLLALVLAIAISAYVGLRIARPGFRLSHARARRLVLTAGTLGGILQGAAGISAPVSISFLNAIRLERAAFIGTIAVFFAAMSLFQLGALFMTGLMTPLLLAQSGLALIPLLLFMPVGAAAARRLSVEGFDRLMLIVLSILALRLLFSSVF